MHLETGAFSIYGQSATKLRIGEGSTTIPEMGVGASAPKCGTSKPKGMMNDIVYALSK